MKFHAKVPDISQCDVCFGEVFAFSLDTDAVVVLTSKQLVVLDLEKGKERWSTALPNRCVCVCLSVCVNVMLEHSSS